ncbi:MAG: hypothetical protein IT210_13200 [Armatimonadetes bacterium]|nr:hypothetical protein [Armatimonadota bacterium]
MDSEFKYLWSLLKAAMFRTPNWVIPLLILMAGFIDRPFLVFALPMALVAGAALTARTMRDESFCQGVLAGQRRKELQAIIEREQEMLESLGQVDSATYLRTRRIEKLAWEIIGLSESAQSLAQAALQASIGEIVRLVEKSLDLAKIREQLRRSFSPADIRNLERECQTLKDKIQGEAESEVQKVLSQSLNLKKRAMARYKSIQARLPVVDAHLQNIEAALNEIKSSVACLGVLQVPDTTSELTSLTDEIAVLERSIDEVITAGQQTLRVNH